MKNRKGKVILIMLLIAIVSVSTVFAADQTGMQNIAESEEGQVQYGQRMMRKPQSQQAVNQSENLQRERQMNERHENRDVADCDGEHEENRNRQDRHDFSTRERNERQFDAKRSHMRPERLQ